MRRRGIHAGSGASTGRDSAAGGSEAGAAIGLALLLVLGVQRVFLGVELANRPIVLLAILLVVTGLQFITFGLLGEMLARTYHESQGKPVYVVRDRLG